MIMLFMLSAICCLGGCNKPGTTQAGVPTSKPAISDAATPTPSITEENPNNVADPTVEPEPTQAPGVPTSTPTSTPTPTATPSPTATPTPTPSPTPIPTVPPAPVAVNTDTTTLDFIINRDYPLTEAYRPDDLVIPDIPFGFSDMTLDKRKLKKVAAEALEELYAAALAEENLTIYGMSGYRSYDRQYDIYGANLINRGIRHTNLYSAAPGNSEHQTGLAIDVSCAAVGFGLVERFATTAEGIWLKENCWRFGFILRYPQEKEHITGYAYEPWHIRYVGVPLAYYLFTNNLTLEEYYGTPASQTLEELEDRPLIDLHTDRFYNLYAVTLGSELYYKADGSIWVSEVTGFPYLKEQIRDTAGNVIKVNGSAFLIEPVYDAEGNYILDINGNICYTKPYFDAEGNLWLDYNASPVFLQPLWNANGTLATDTAGNILYTEPQRDLFGLEVITETGSLIPKVPVRDENGELIFNPDGTVCFYEPYINPATGGYILDTATGLPLYPSKYYEIPHNTLPLPPEEKPPVQPDPNNPETWEGLTPEELWELLFPEESQGNTEEEVPDPEDPGNTTTDETGGFFE